MIKTCHGGEGKVRNKHILSLEKGGAERRTGHDRAASGSTGLVPLRRARKASEGRWHYKTW